MPIFTNYLQLGERLSQIWINRYTLILLLGVLKLVFFSRSLKYALTTSESYILANCASIDKLYANITTNTPHYLGLMGNYMVEKTLQETVSVTLKTLSMLVYASEELLTFMIDLYLGTYACLIVSAIDGTVDIATNTTEKLIGVVNDTVASFANELDDGLDDISKVINKVMKAASKVEHLFTDDDDDDGTDKVASVNLTISALRHLYIPASINDKLKELSAKTPSFDTVKNDTKHLIAEPFEYVRKEIKNINTTSLFANKTMLYVPPIRDITSNGTGICSSNKPEIEHVYDILVKTVKTISIIFIILMAVGAVCVLVPIAWEEYVMWSRLQELKDDYVSKTDFYNDMNDLSDISTVKSVPYEGASDIVSSYQKVFHRWQTRVANMFIYIFTLGNRKNMTRLQVGKIEWFVAYITSERALVVLGLAVLALLVCGCQLIIISVLRNKIKGDDMNLFIKNVSNKTNNDYFKQDMDIWGTQTNLYINTTEHEINTKVFGWVDKTTTSINDTVNVMVNDIDKTLADIFNGTLLYNPMKTVVKCVIENKLYTVEKAMTWINDKAHLDIPRVNATDIQKSIQYQTENPTSKFSSITEELITDIRRGIMEILNAFHKTAIVELYISFGILAIWVVQIPIALIILYFKSL